MSKFEDYWELQQSFTNNEELSTWLHRKFHFFSKVYVMYEGEDYYCIYRFLLDDLDSSFDFFHANEEREKNLGNDFCNTRSEAVIVWKHEEYLRFGIEHILKFPDCYKDVQGTMIVTTSHGHHVFRRKTEPYPKPASRP